MDRREFLLTPLILLNYEDDYDIKQKIKKTTNLSLESILKIKNLNNLKENNFSIIYNLFQDVSDTIFGTGSMNYDKEKNIFDLGLDDFSTFSSISLSILSIFSKDYQDILDLNDKHYFLRFYNGKWVKYEESYSRNEEKKEDSDLYEYQDNIVKLNNNEFVSGNNINNPLSLAFEIINGNKIDEAELISNKKYDNVKLNFTQLNHDFNILECEFPNPIIGNFKKVYLILLNNIPISGYVYQDNEKINYIRGELKNIKINDSYLL